MDLASAATTNISLNKRAPKALNRSPADMCKFLLEEKHIYLLKNGRISMAGVSDSNLDYIAQSIDEAVKKFG